MKNFTETGNPVSRNDRREDQESGATHLSYLGKGLLQILDSLPFYVLLIDKNHRILLANKATRDTIGMDAEEIVGQYCPRVVHGLETGSFPGCPLEDAVINKRSVEREHFDEGTSRWLKISVYPTEAWSIDGQGIYFHMVQDITRQKEAIEKLKEKETGSAR
ncbi:MAG: PAS domain-containing protein [Thermoleophilia bacterium]|nr:PAS domain-containing protein [Thermoleophilia bacterium]